MLMTLAKRERLQSTRLGSSIEIDLNLLKGLSILLKRLVDLIKGAETVTELLLQSLEYPTRDVDDTEVHLIASCPLRRLYQLESNILLALLLTYGFSLSTATLA